MTAPTRRGLMLVLSSPSGGGKTTIARRLREQDPELNLSISATTRAQRPGEVDGEHYLFTDREGFEQMVRDGALLEHAEVFGKLYGTPRAPVEAHLAAGRDVLFDIDWQGTRQLAAAARADLVSVFVLPPSAAELERRLTGRGRDDPAEIARRMAKAGAETSHWAEYDYVIVNDVLDHSVATVRAILAAERLRRHRRPDLAALAEALVTACGGTDRAPSR